MLKLALAYRDTVQNVDAIASAPYFGYDIKETKIDPGDTNALFRELDRQINEVAGQMRKGKSLADQYGVRYVTYEAGEGVINSGPDDLAVGRLNRDPRMADLYHRYLDTWGREAGDLIMIFGNISPVRPQSAWGLAEYPGQPLSETPKRRAVLETIAASHH